MDRQIRVLSASVDPHLNHSRALLLRHHGFDVTTSESTQQARTQMERESFDVLIFGTTLPRDSCWELAGVFRRRNASGKIIEIVPAPSAAPKNQPDAVVISADEPSILVDTIRENLRARPKLDEDERWLQLCREAATEQDPKKVMKLVEEINRLLRQRKDPRSKPPSE